MGEIDRYGKTSITWNRPVNTQFIWENWDAMFDVYIKNVTIREHNSTMPLLSWDYLGETPDNMTMNFQARFHEPFMLGLLTKKSDRLYVHLKYDLLDIGEERGRFKNAKFRGMFLDEPIPQDNQIAKERQNEMGSKNSWCNFD